MFQTLKHGLSLSGILGFVSSPPSLIPSVSRNLARDEAGRKKDWNVVTHSIHHKLPDLDTSEMVLGLRNLRRKRTNRSTSEKAVSNVWLALMLASLPYLRLPRNMPKIFSWSFFAFAFVSSPSVSSLPLTSRPPTPKVEARRRRPLSKFQIWVQGKREERKQISTRGLSRAQFSKFQISKVPKFPTGLYFSKNFLGLIGGLVLLRVVNKDSRQQF